ncbi:Importin subunit beta-3 [Thelohanellus kitauei]|uniref:Importin subunit beta-3 n=1 Tax=Thelohanellus kitauei TaxID=669202 RepID=A0A0C2M315_THEKT|nr:Importin subunit beta-3 [Thelohanellus kitauei]
MSKLAASLVDKFAKYYPNIVPELLALLRSLSSTLHTKFYIAALDALGHILMAVGLEKCKPDIGAVLAIVKQFEIGTIKKESGRDFQLEYLEILVYLARVLGANFSPIIPHLLPTLFELTSAPLDNPLVNSPWAVIEDLTGSSTMPRLLSAHTDAVEDRVNALSIVNKLFKLLKGDMLPHVEAMLDITIKNFTEIFDESVQLTCLQLFANLLKSAETSQTDLSVRIWEKIFNVFCNRVLNHNPLFEPEQTFEGIEKCLKVLSFKGINDQLLVKTMEIMKVEIDRTIKDYGSTILSKTPEEETITPDDDDYSDFEDDMESGERSLSAIMDLQRYLFKQLGAKFLPFWEQVHNDVFGLSQVLNPSMRSYSIYMFSNLFEFAPAESVNSTDNVLGVIIRGLSDPELTVRHSAVSTVGTVSEFASAHYKQFLEFVLPVIVKMICSTPASKVRDSVIDCAISVVGKIMKYQPAIIMSFDTAVQTWISWLPIQDDDVNFALEYLLELIET